MHAHMWRNDFWGQRHAKIKPTSDFLSMEFIILRTRVHAGCSLTACIWHIRRFCSHLSSMILAPPTPDCPKRGRPPTPQVKRMQKSGQLDPNVDDPRGAPTSRELRRVAWCWPDCMLFSVTIMASRLLFFWGVTLRFELFISSTNIRYCVPVSLDVAWCWSGLAIL